METVEEVELGNGTGSSSTSSNTTDFNTAMNSYNNAISRLNTRAEAYRNTTYSSSARSVGSVPNNKNTQSGYFTSSYSYMENYNGKLRDEDENYLTDYNQMEDLGIEGIGEYYWLASRYVHSDSTISHFYVRYVYGQRRHQRHPRLVQRP